MTVRKTDDVNTAVERARAELPIVSRRIFFNTGWSGPSPRLVLDEQKRMLEWLSTEGVSHHNYAQLSKDLDVLRSRLAALFGADADEIAIARSTTSGINIVLGGFDWERGQKVVTTNVEHGAVLIPVYALRDRYGVEVEIVDLSDGRNVLRKLARAIDKRTKLVVLSHVSFNTGLRLPLKELAALVADRGTQLLVDGAQSAGAIKVNFHEIGCDYYAFPGHKWMLGPDSTGALYIRRDRLAGLKLCFAGNESAKKFDSRGKVVYQRTARKFEMCDFNATLISGWLKALDFMEEFGVDSIERAIRENTGYLKTKLARVKGVRVLTPRKWTQSAGLVSIEFVRKRAKDAFAALLKQGIIVRYTPPPSYLRISVNYFNTRAEMDALVDALERFSRKA
ncbi:MAG: aminotransferase class V-fold PLP-dependent enzyme [Candidatus Abyssobacteria bacterium SURF_17]|jgi:L-cysteine/cystine lyase|uniref:Aminotransferase class V-fold PLP-dependent enzyme n=1 Tax=Candidatus Abyssobacteria bacterium SURF_17 TaxID=2093361 RepID=A0A419F6E1_9BACT|nr:MAG: aminotransferase class V-fold PLP-dependent enzyme [Candidatus Abyssubacteria bacterium SURF_17]